MKNSAEDLNTNTMDEKSVIRSADDILYIIPYIIIEYA